MRLASISKNSPTRRSCSRAISNGFSRRWVSGASTAVTGTPCGWVCSEYTPLFDAEFDLREARRAAVRRDGREGERVPALGKDGAVRPTAGQAEDVAAGKQVALAHEQAQEPALAGRELEVEALRGPQPRSRPEHVPDGDGEQRRVRVGGADD